MYAQQQPQQPGVSQYKGYGAATNEPGIADPYGQQSGYNHYPMKPMGEVEPRRSFGIIGVVFAFLLPFCMFAAIFHMITFNWSMTGLATTICWLIVAVLAYFTLSAFRRKAAGGNEWLWYAFLTITCILAILMAKAMGSTNWKKNMGPYYDVMDLNVYPSVDPQVARGQQFMDAGRIQFTPTTRLDISKSMGFKNMDIYCVAPMVSGNGSMQVYDFWAVGINCCSGHVADFACGEFSNPMAISGLRLMRDDQRSFFRLAVQQAEASYNIRSSHPMFFYFMQDPMGEINAYQDAGMQYYVQGVFTFLCLQAALVVVAYLLFSKLA